MNEISQQNAPSYSVNRDGSWTSAGQEQVQKNQNGSYRVMGFVTPPPINFDTDEMRGSIQFILSENIGEYVVVEFLVGTQEITRKQGILFYVGNSFITLYDDNANNFIVCDVFSVKFVYFYLPGQRPDFNVNTPPSGEARPRTTPQRR